MKKKGNTKKEVNRLIYENSNTYRLHADNLRWTLLGGYAVFFTAAATLLSNTRLDPIDTSILKLTLFIVSNVYLLVLAVQNWFYNLFSKFSKDCEYRLLKGKNLRSLEKFTKKKGSHINPVHPAFFFAELIIALTSFYFLFSIFASSLITYIDSLFIAPPIPWLIFIIIVIVALSLYLIVANYFLFRHWNDYIYNGIIKRFSNLWKSPHKDET